MISGRKRRRRSANAIGGRRRTVSMKSNGKDPYMDDAIIRGGARPKGTGPGRQTYQEVAAAAFAP